MRTKQLASILTSAALLAGTFCTTTVFQNNSTLFAAPLTVSAAGAVTSGTTGPVFVGTASKRLWFDLNSAGTGLEVCGSTISGSNAALEIPKTVTYNRQALPVTGIRQFAFYNQTNLGSLKIDRNNITSIGDAAFLGCTNLKSVSNGEKNGATHITYIGESAFSGCSSLENMIFASGAETFGAHAFYECTSLDSITLGSVRSIGSAAFYHCSSANCIEITSPYLSSIPIHTFANCESAKRITLPENLAELGTMAFCGCRAVDRIYLPDSVTQIGESAFMGCSALRTVMMSEGIISVGNYAFFDCPLMKFFVSKNPNAMLGTWAAGWHLKNGNAVRNADFTYWSNGSGRVSRYAQNNGFRYHNISEAAALAKERIRDYVWATPNTNGSAWRYHSGLYFNAQHTPYANGLLGQTSSGLCSGLATVSALTASGYLNVSDFAPGYSRICDIPKNSNLPADTISYVTTVYANFLKAYDYVTIDRDSDSKCRFGDEMLRYAEYITYGADPAVFVIDQMGYKPGHAMVCFGLEFKDYAPNANAAYWNNMDARLLIYDVNRSTLSDTNINTDSVYVNFQTDDWKWAHIDGVQYSTDYCDFCMSVAPSSVAVDGNAFFDAIRLPQ